MVSYGNCDYLNEDKQLTVGRTVRAYWCKDGFYYQSEGIITSLCRDKVTVKLQKQVAWSDDYRIGNTIQVPRISDSIRWSSRNCVRPLKKPSLAS